MKTSILYTVLITIAVSTILPSTSYAGPKDSLATELQLRKSGPYDTTEMQTFPDFQYASAADPDLSRLRTRFHLDSVAGNGDDTSRAIRLLEWFHNQVPHEDVKPLTILTAENIIESYRTRHISQACFPLSIGMNEVFLSMGFKSRSVICFANEFDPEGGHVIDAVYMKSLRKWIYMDPQDNAYFKDEHGNFLSIEVRDRLISGGRLYLNKTANYHHIPDSAGNYLYGFMAKHLYRMICPLSSAYNSQTRTPGKTLQYVELMPVGGIDPARSRFETGVYKNYSVISYHTNNVNLFWKAPY